MEEIMETEVETTEAGANEQEVAETASIGPDETGENEPETAEPAAEGQSVEDNARFAAARRRAEAQFNQRIELERQAARDEMIRQMYDGQLDPYTNRPISSEADLRAYQQAYQREQEQLTRNQMQQAGLDPDILDRMIENNPKVKRAEQLTAQFEAAEGERKMNEAIKEISHLDPSITDVAALANHPNAPVFNEYVNRGYSLVDAFRLANFDTLTGKKAAAAKQQAMNNVNGKSHLTTTAGNAGGDDVVIDPQEMQMMKHAFPNLTHAQLVAKFKKYK
jgi:hypothetical protein